MPPEVWESGCDEDKMDTEDKGEDAVMELVSPPDSDAGEEDSTEEGEEEPEDDGGAVGIVENGSDDDEKLPCHGYDCIVLGLGLIRQ